MKKISQIAVGVGESRISTIFLEYTRGAIQDRFDISPSFLPFRKAGGLQIRRYQGLAVAHYGFTLGALALKPSGFCNIGVKPDRKRIFSIRLSCIKSLFRKISDIALL